MFFDHKHCCKSPYPFDATTFDIQAEKGKPVFSADFELSVRVAISSKKAPGEGEDSDQEDVPTELTFEENKVTIPIELDQNHPQKEVSVDLCQRLV